MEPNIIRSQFFTSSQLCGQLERQAHYAAPGCTVSSIFIHQTHATSPPLLKNKTKQKKHPQPCPHMQCLQPHFQMEVNGKGVAWNLCVPPRSASRDSQ